MFAIAFDLTLATADALHPLGQRSAYADIGRVLKRHGFQRVQGSVYLNRDDDLAAVTWAMSDLRALPWFPESVRDIRAFKVEDWSDFTGFIKQRERG